MGLTDFLQDEEQVLSVATALFSFLGILLAIISQALPNWSHFSLDRYIDGINTLISFHWGPWKLCFTANSGSSHCQTVSQKWVLNVGTDTEIDLVEKKPDFQAIQACRAFGVLMILVGVVVVASAVTSLLRINLPEVVKPVARGCAFFCAACGFIATCLWAKIADHNEEVYGGAFSVNIAAWMFFLFAGATSSWQAATGIPPVVRKYLRPVTALLIFALLVAACAHQAWSVTNYTDELSIFITTKVGLWTICDHVAFHIAGDPPSTECENLSAGNVGDFDWGRIQACQAMMVIAVVAMFFVLCSIAYGYVTQNYDHVFFKARVLLSELAVMFSFITMCVWASMTTDSEYGTGFALNCGAWVILLLWLVFEIRVERGATESGTAGSSVGYSMAT